MNPSTAYSAWTPERRAQLNAHIARTLGWTTVQVLATNVAHGFPPGEALGEAVKYRIACSTPRWADGVQETWSLLRDYLDGTGYSFMVDCEGDPALQVCLEWCRWRGAPFNG